MELTKSDYGSLSPLAQLLTVLGSLLIVAFGQPAWVPPLGLVAAACGYALLWRVMFCWRSRLFRFTVSSAWFTTVQLVQLSWMTADDYQGSYIYGVWLLLSLGLGLQFGFLSLMVRRGSLKSLLGVSALSLMWVVMEWSRLFLLSGFSWNPVGLAFAGSEWAMQPAALVGVYGLSFLVFFTNLMLLRAWALSDDMKALYAALGLLVAPYLFGIGHLWYHQLQQEEGELRTLLVQTGEPPRLHAQKDSLEIWEKVFRMVAEKQEAGAQLVVLPEAMVSYGTFQTIYPKEEVIRLFSTYFPELKPPPMRRPLARMRGEGEWYVSNAFIAQGLANALQADLLVGLEDASRNKEGEIETYNAAFFFSPGELLPNRYEKRILVPMGEYIPYEWTRSYAALYGIYGSFTAGRGAKVFEGNATPPFAPSICYEETYGDLMREGRRLGAELLVNLTNDVWYPNSRLPRQHFEHARLRSVESGVPLIRACNTGVTGAVDSLGRTIAILEEDGVAAEWTAGALVVDVPTYHYQTYYAELGDGLIIGLAFLFVGIAFRYRVLTFV